MSTRLDAPPPPPVDVVVDNGRGWGTDWVELVTARDDIDAHLLAGRLELIGIETRKVKHRSAPVWLFGGANPWAPVTILVRRYQLDDARLLLAEVSLDAPDIDPVAPRAPAPKGVPRIWWVTAMVVGAAVVVTIFVQVFEQTTGCQLPFFCKTVPADDRP